LETQQQHLHVRQLRLEREEIDNAHKEKTWNVFGPEFAVELTLSDS
jgi:hypothetical protein